MSTTYYIRLRGRREGPFTREQLHKLAGRGHFSRHYEVSFDGETWTRAETMPELFPEPIKPRSKPEPEVQATVVTDPGPEPADWFYTQAGAELGPVTLSQLRALFHTGIVSGEEFAWHERLGDWRRLVDLPELAQPQPAVAQHGPAPVCPLAITSFILGICGGTVLPVIGSLPAIVFGHASLSRIAKSKGTLGGKGLALAGAILGYLVLIPAVIIGLVLLSLVVLGPKGTKVTRGATAAPLAHVSGISK